MLEDEGDEEFDPREFVLRSNESDMPSFLQQHGFVPSKDNNERWGFWHKKTRDHYLAVTFESTFWVLKPHRREPDAPGGWVVEKNRYGAKDVITYLNALPDLEMEIEEAAAPVPPEATGPSAELPVDLEGAEEDEEFNPRDYIVNDSGVETALKALGFEKIEGHNIWLKTGACVWLKDGSTVLHRVEDYEGKLYYTRYQGGVNIGGSKGDPERVLRTIEAHMNESAELPVDPEGDEEFNPRDYVVDNSGELVDYIESVGFKRSERSIIGDLWSYSPVRDTFYTVIHSKLSGLWSLSLAYGYRTPVRGFKTRQSWKHKGNAEEILAKVKTIFKKPALEAEEEGDEEFSPRDYVVARTPDRLELEMHGAVDRGGYWSIEGKEGTFLHLYPVKPMWNMALFDADRNRIQRWSGYLSDMLAIADMYADNTPVAESLEPEGDEEFNPRDFMLQNQWPPEGFTHVEGSKYNYRSAAILSRDKRQFVISVDKYTSDSGFLVRVYGVYDGAEVGSNYVLVEPDENLEGYLANLTAWISSLTGTQWEMQHVPEYAYFFPVNEAELPPEEGDEEFNPRDYVVSKDDDYASVLDARGFKFSGRVGQLDRPDAERDPIYSKDFSYGRPDVIIERQHDGRTFARVILSYYGDHYSRTLTSATVLDQYLKELEDALTNRSFGGMRALDRKWDSMRESAELPAEEVEGDEEFNPRDYVVDASQTDLVEYIESKGFVKMDSSYKGVDEWRLDASDDIYYYVFFSKRSRQWKFLRWEPVYNDTRRRLSWEHKGTAQEVFRKIRDVFDAPLAEAAEMPPVPPEEEGDEEFNPRDFVVNSEPPAPYGLDKVVQAYAGCALWSSTDDDGGPLDSLYSVSDIDSRSMAKMRSDCADFMRANEDDLNDWDLEQTGHDLWLTRNGHGAGFWDRNIGTEESRRRLTDAAHAMGEVNLFVTGDGQIMCESMEGKPAAHAWLNNLSAAVSANRGGFHFEEGGCFAFAAALYDIMKDEGAQPEVCFSQENTHAYMRLGSEYYDHQGRASAPASCVVVDRYSVESEATKHGSTADEFFSDYAWAKKCVEDAENLNESVADDTDKEDTDERVVEAKRKALEFTRLAGGVPLSAHLVGSFHTKRMPKDIDILVRVESVEPLMGKPTPEPTEHMVDGFVVDVLFYDGTSWAAFGGGAVIPVKNVVRSLARRFESMADDIAKEAYKAEEPKSPEQAEAGNYAKGHIRLHGMDITIENAKGSVRKGTDKNGKEWSVVMPCVYGYIVRV